MNNKRTYTENQKYKEFHENCVGIDYVEWDDGSKGYIYFEESTSGNRSEVFYKTLETALVEYDEADDYFISGTLNE